MKKQTKRWTMQHLDEAERKAAEKARDEHFARLAKAFLFPQARYHRPFLGIHALPEESKSDAPHACKCDMQHLMMKGCQCGGK
jgi:hypothetical protein